MIFNGIIWLRGYNLGIVISIMRSSVYSLPVPVFLQGLAGVDFAHRKDP